MAKARRPRPKPEPQPQHCAWCANPLHGDYVTVTFPDKDQLTLHLACLYQYRAVMWPAAPP